MLSLVLLHIFWFPQLITAQHHRERRLPYAVVMRSLQEMWLIEEMCSLSCELIIYVNCKQEFAYGASMITDEAVHANKRIWEIVAQFRIWLPLWPGHNNSYDLENAGLGHTQYKIWGCDFGFRVWFWSEEWLLQKYGVLNLRNIPNPVLRIIPANFGDINPVLRSDSK